MGKIAETLEIELSKSLKKIKNAEAKERLTLSMTNDIERMRAGTVPDNISKYASFAEEPPASLGDYFPGDGIVMFDEIGRIMEVLESLEKEEAEWFVSLLEEGQIVHNAKLSFTFEELDKMIYQQKIQYYLFFFGRYRELL